MSSPYKHTNKQAYSPYNIPRTPNANTFSPSDFSSPINNYSNNQGKNFQRNFRGFNNRHNNSFSYGDRTNRKYQSFKNFNKNNSFNTNSEIHISEYFHISMIEDPWAFLEMPKKVENTIEDVKNNDTKTDLLLNECDDQNIDNENQ